MHPDYELFHVFVPLVRLLQMMAIARKVLLHVIYHFTFYMIFLVQATPECTQNEDCPLSDICHLGSCSNACIFKKCGSNALCETSVHAAFCFCPDDHTGNPDNACYLSKKRVLLYENIFQCHPLSSFSSYCCTNYSRL